MRKINHYLGAIAVAGLSLGFAACSSEDIVGPDDPNNTDVERTLYVNVAIHGDAAGSRASSDNGAPDEGNTDTNGNMTDFANGTGVESQVNSVYLVFYDANGSVVGNITQIQGDFTQQTGANGTIESQMNKVVEVTLRQGQAEPTQVMCYINPVNSADLMNPLSEMQLVTRNKVTNNNDQEFPMSNSVYYNADGNIQIAAVIPKDALHTTQQAANEALTGTDPNKKVTIYVERYAAKLTVSQIATPAVYETCTTEDAPLSTTIKEIPVNLTFNVKGWALNGEAKYTYPVKSFRQFSTAGQILPDNYTYNDLNARINAQNAKFTLNDDGTWTIDNGTTLSAADSWAWNNSNYNRSYWACSPVYFQATYPEVLDDYDAETSNQTFVTYEQAAKSGLTAKSIYYCKETTSGIPALRSKNPNAAIPSVILVGEYQISVNGTAVDPATTFYTYVNTNKTFSSKNDQGDVEQIAHPSVYFEVADGSKTAASAVNNGLSMQKRFLHQTTVLYKKNDAGAFVRMTVAENLETMASITELATPSKEVLTTTDAEGNVQIAKFAARARTLQIIAGANTTEIYVNDNGTPKNIKQTAAEVTDPNTEISLTDANRILWQNVGSCNRYDGGAGFFNIPVKHLGWYRKGNTETAIDFAKVRVGDLGIVRNHTYNISIDAITGLAAGIGSQDQEIIPPADTKKVFMAYSINVLRWAVVPTQHVELK